MPRTDDLLAAVDTYFRGLYYCDVLLLDTVFHPASSLFDVDEGVVTVDPYPAWREVVANRASPASVDQERDEEVVTVDWLSEKAAVVHVRLRVLDAIFVDQLSFVDGPDGWQIVAKVWHLESTVGPSDTVRITCEAMTASLRRRTLPLLPEPSAGKPGL